MRTCLCEKLIIIPTASLLKNLKISMSQTLFEKLNLKDEKTVLIQGLPSSIEKQFSKLSFAKNLTPLLRNRKIDFALVFAVSENQLNNILSDIMPALKDETKLWVAYPKLGSKIVTDLNRESSWSKLVDAGYESNDQVDLDHVWNAVNYRKNETLECELELESVSVEVTKVKNSRKVKN